MHHCLHKHMLWMLVLLVCTLLSACESSPIFGTSGRVVVRDGNTTVAVIFSDHDRRLISDYYHSKKRNLPPGLAKKKRLPPGLEKQVRRNGVLPPGLQRDSLPHDLEQQLSRLPEGYVRIIIGTDIVLQDSRTGVAVDVIKDIAY